MSRFCERGKESSLQANAEKSNIGSGEIGEEIPTFDGGFDMAVQMGFVHMGVSGEMGGDSLISGELDRAVQEAFAPMGCSSSGIGVGATFVVLVAGDLMMGGLTSGLVEVSHVSSSGNHPNFADVVAKSLTIPVKRAKVSCHQPLLDQNRFSPISEKVSDSFDEETMLLNWVNPTESDRDEEERQLMEYVPLAQWDPNGGLVLMTEEVDPVDTSVEDDLEPSAWVSKKV